ncbi:hypothetical protein [Blastomonas sp.]|uniref:hypothetical protein n=1 Tax=Blastomonas sp. TaxID=1909299 RepID=UPI0026193452|nr:hypothetical protein [Blastomonas sp.]MDM7956683.1 hypothetical protein [Blastomonas sp.]
MAAVATGVLTMVLTGIPAVRWIPNIAAWLVGGVAAIAIVRTTPRPRIWFAIACAGVLLLAATLAAPGQMDVHRWIAIGPVQVNIAALVLPAVVVALAKLGSAHRAPPILATVLIAILALQPDASQAIALALACLAWLLPARTPSGWAAIGSIGGLAGLSLMQPDPLLPVAEVEQIIGLAGSIHVALSAVALTALIGLPVLVRRSRPGGAAAMSLAIYMAAIIVAPMFGWFPVPLVGAGMSFVLGLWLGAALLAATLNGSETR